MEIPVYVIPDYAPGTEFTNIPEVDKDRMHRVADYFNNPIFKRKIITRFELPAELPGNTDAPQHLRVEEFIVRWALNDAASTYPNSPVCIIKETSISLASPDSIADSILSGVNIENWDVLYLCKWLDRCDLYTSRKPVLGSNLVYVTTQSPKGVQALLFAPSGRDVVLGKENMRNSQPFIEPYSVSLSVAINQAVALGGLKARATTPNLFEFDPLAARNNEDYLKTQECLVPMNANQVPSNSDQQPIIINNEKIKVLEEANGEQILVQPDGTVEISSPNAEPVPVPWWVYLIIVLAVLILIILIFSFRRRDY